MFKDYYQQQLDNLRRLAAEFAKEHPALAPMLAGQSRDPDVERLLEGMAYLTGMLSARLDDSFPEIVHNLMQLCSPQYLRSVPSSVIMNFTPNSSLRESLKVKAGTEIKSLPVAGTQCIYRTCFDVDVYPLSLQDAYLEEIPGQLPEIKLIFSPLAVEEGLPSFLRLFLADEYVHAASLFYILQTKVKEVIFTSGSETLSLKPEVIKAPFFSLDAYLFPYPENSFPAYRLLQEYFVLPEKFLFVDIYGWDKWRQMTQPGTGFELRFILDSDVYHTTRVTGASFALFCTPAVNLFKHDAAPIQLDHRSFEYKVMPAGDHGSVFQIFSLDRVRGIVQGSVKKKEYHSLEVMGTDKDAGAYYKNIRLSPVTGKPETYISVAYDEKQHLQREVIMLDITCTNGDLVNSLQVGDICEETDTSPVLCAFRNITTPTPNYPPVLDKDNLWRFLSHYSINIFSLSSAAKLQEILKLYLDIQKQDARKFYANIKKIEGILNLTIKQGTRLHRGCMLSGHDIALTMSADYFTGRGDMYIFIRLLDYFFAYYAAINSYTRLIVEDKTTGELIQCPARFGEQPLI